MHGSRGDSAQVERSLEGGVKEKTAVSEASGRKQDSNERLVEAIGRGESVGTKGSGGHSEDHDWKGIRDIGGGYEDTGDVQRERGGGYFSFGLRVRRHAVDAKAGPRAGRNN